MRKLLLVLALLWPTGAWAQCNGVFQPNTLCGNLSASPAPPAQFSASGTVVGPASATSGHVVTFVTSLGTQIGDIPTISTSQAFNFSGNTSFSGVNTFAGATSLNAITNFTSQFWINGIRIQFPVGPDTVGGLGTNQTWTGTNSWTSAVSFSSAPTGAGITSLFAAPPTIGQVTPAPGTFTTLSGTATSVSALTANGGVCSPTAQGLCLANIISQATINTPTTTSLSWVSGGTSIFSFDARGHFNTRTAVTSPNNNCTGGVMTAGSTDQAGRISTTGSPCTISFANTYAAAPFCVVVGNTTAGFVAVTTQGTTSFTFQNSAGGPNSYNYVCLGL